MFFTLACELATKRSVWLIDADSQGTTTEWLEGGLPPVKCEALPLEDERKAQAWLQRVKSLPADLVVIDLPPQNGASTAAALMLADLILVPVAPSGLDLRAASKALDLLKEAREAARSAGVVPRRSPHRRRPRD
jgi:chromosome partitioning protein